MVRRARPRFRVQRGGVEGYVHRVPFFRPGFGQSRSFQGTDEHGAPDEFQISHQHGASDGCRGVRRRAAARGCGHRMGEPLVGVGRHLRSAGGHHPEGEEPWRRRLRLYGAGGFFAAGRQGLDAPYRRLRYLASPGDERQNGAFRRIQNLPGEPHGPQAFREGRDIQCEELLYGGCRARFQMAQAARLRRIHLHRTLPLRAFGRGADTAEERLL